MLIVIHILAFGMLVELLIGSSDYSLSTAWIS